MSGGNEREAGKEKNYAGEHEPFLAVSLYEFADRRALDQYCDESYVCEQVSVLCCGVSENIAGEKRECDIKIGKCDGVEK